MKPGLLSASFVAISVAYAAPAEAAKALGVECELVEDSLIEVDGMLDDWSSIRSRQSGDEDAGFRVRCAHSKKTLFLAVHVTDDAVVRVGNKRSRKQDRLTLILGAAGRYARLSVLPGTRGFEPVYRWRGKPVREPARVADSAQRDGWSVELAAPLEDLAAWGPGTPKLVYKLRYVDKDGGKDRGGARLRGTIRFAGATRVYLSFMEHTGLSRKDVRVDRLGNFDGARGIERVIVGDRVIGVLDDEYRYLTLPIRSASDLLEVKVLDLGGDGRMSIVTQYRERGNGGSRDVLAVWNLQPTGEFARALAVEVRKQLGDNVLENEWSLVRKKGKRRRRKAKGYELVVKAGEVTGWDEDSFDDVPPQDMRPILTPWAEQTRAVYTFEDGQAFGGEPPTR